MKENADSEALAGDSAPEPDRSKAACASRPEVGARSRGWLWFALAGSLLIGSVSLGLAALVIEDRQAALEQNLLERAEDAAEARSTLVSTWLDGFTRLARRVTRSELVQLYAEGMTAGDGAEPAGWLAGQQPFLRQLLGDFVAQHDLLAASLVAAGGDVIIRTGDLPQEPVLPAGIEHGASAVVGSFYEVVMPPSVRPSLAFDIALPVAPAMADEAVPAVFVMTVPALPAVIDLLTRGAPEELPPARLAQPDGAALVFAAGRLTLQAGAAGGGDGAAIRMPVNGTGWLVEQPVGTTGAGGATAVSLRRQTFTVAVAAAVLLSLAFIAFCGAAERRRRREREAALRIVEDQASRFRHLFEEVAGAVSDGVGLKDRSGRYLYANAALGLRFGRAADEIVGRSDEELRCGDDRAGARLAVADGTSRELPAAAGEETGMALVVAPRRTVASLAAVAHPSADPGLEVALPDHVTIDQAVGLLVRAVELRDPFLKGHGDRMADLAGAVARRLELGDRDRRTIELAARLSQVGKIFIPDAILTKPGRHTADESAVMRTHIIRALDVLERIDFGLPVTEALGQIHERLDGSGHPNALQGSEIGMPGRVLAAVDVFCARTAPRSYRDQVSPGQALFHLAGHPERYDQRVVTALVAAVAEGHGQLALPAPTERVIDAA